ncbi:MAG: Uma2 family endonuclease [Chloroflexota bacterium]
MAAPKLDRRWTYQDLLDLPDDGVRREIIDGELHEMTGGSRSHQRTLINLVMLLEPFVSALGHEVSIAPYDVLFKGADPVEPDLFVVRKDNPGHLGERGFEGTPDLVVEILSVSTRGHDIVRKRDLYLRAGVPEYWLVDPDSRSIEVLTLRDAAYLVSFFADEDEIASVQLAGLRISPAAVFAGVADPEE